MHWRRVQSIRPQLLTTCPAIKISMPLLFPGMNAKECILGMLKYAASLSHPCITLTVASHCKQNLPLQDQNRSVEKQEFQLLQVMEAKEPCHRHLNLNRHGKQATMGNFLCCCRCCCKKNTEHVRFNVGGKKFDTTWGTVTRRGKDMDNLLALLISCQGCCCFCKPKGVKRLKMRGYPNSGTFIDRDPTQFRHILNWLREDADGVLPQLDERSFRALLKEAEYYRLLDMVKAIYETLNPTMEYV